MKENGIIKKRYGFTKCVFCGRSIVKNRPDQDTCYDCYKKNHHKTVSNYNNDVSRVRTGYHTCQTKGRALLLSMGFDLTNHVIHHANENPNDNRLANLIIINRSKHAKLHRLLEREWSLLLKDDSCNLENCWDTVRDQITTAYLETESANVVKISDIRQSAAEPLNKEKIYIFELQEEGSETMH